MAANFEDGGAAGPIGKANPTKLKGAKQLDRRGRSADEATVIRTADVLKRSFAPVTETSEFWQFRLLVNECDGRKTGAGVYSGWRVYDGLKP